MWDFDLMDSNVFLYHEVSIGIGLESWNKSLTFFTDGWDTGHFVFATACAFYASKLVPNAQRALANCEHNFTRFYTIFLDLLPHAQGALAIGYHMRSVRLQSWSHANFAKSSFNQWKKWKIRKSYFDTFKWTSKESETTFFGANLKSKIVASVHCTYAIAKIKWYVSGPH